MATLGGAGVVDLIGIVGYDSLVAMTLVATELGADEIDPFAGARRQFEFRRAHARAVSPAG